MAVAYEKRDADVGRVGRIGFFVGSIVAIAFVAMWWLFGFLVDHEMKTSGQPHPMAGRMKRTEPPAPILQTNPSADLRALRAREQAVLDTYGWIDRERGLVRIPIEKAMDLLAKRGILARPKPAEGDS
jgi:hypothetical protein